MAVFDVLMVGTFPEDVNLIQGGVQASVYGLCGALEDHSDIGAIRVFAPPVDAPYSARERVLGRMRVRYLNIPLKFQFTNILHALEVGRAARSMTRPVAHVHGTGTLQLALCALFAINRTPFVWTLHGITEKETLTRWRERRSLPNLGRYLLYRVMERSMLRLARDIIVDTLYVQQALTYARKPMHVIPQGIFLDEFHQRAAAGTRRETVVLSVGVLDPRKGHHLTMRAFAKILPRFPGARLAIVGIKRSESYYQLLIDTAAELGITDSVDLRPSLPRQAIIDLLATSYVFALHSQEESQGIALCEAMASGLPVVSTNVGGIPFVVTDQQDGFLVEYGDIDGFADALARLLGDADLRDRMATKAVAGSHRFSWASTADEVARLYRATLDARQRPARGTAD